MIFLLKDGQYKVIDDKKALRKYKKLESKISAVMIDCSTRLHSDCWTIVTPEHFKTTIDPITISYTLALYDIENSPIDELRTVTREISIDDPISFYQVAALLYQMSRSDEIGDPVSTGYLQITIIGLRIKMANRKDAVWDADNGVSLKEFISDYGMWCDTDTFLDASSSRATMIEDGAYITRYNKENKSYGIDYYYHEKKYMLQLYQNRWGLTDKTTTLIKKYDAGELGAVYGLCMNGTGLLYLAPLMVAMNILETQSLMLLGYYYDGDHIGNIEVDSEGNSQYREALEAMQNEIRGMSISGSHTEEAREMYDLYDDFYIHYEGYNTADIMYMALYLPQIWDLHKYFTGIAPTSLNVMLLQMNHYQRTTYVRLPKLQKNQAIQVDLFAILASLLSEPLEDVSNEPF